MAPQTGPKKVVKTWRPERDLPRQYRSSISYVQRVRFRHLKSADFLETRWGPPLFDALVANLVAMMCDADVCSWITTTRFNRKFKWDVKQAPREAPDSDC